MKRIVVIADIGWSIGRIHKDLETELKSEYEFKYYNPTRFYLEALQKDFAKADICLTTFNLYASILQLFKKPEERKKIAIVCHGHSEITNGGVWTEDITYGVVSDVLVPFFPKGVSVVPNGVDANLFTRKHHNGIIRTLGWCGACGVLVKRIDWSYKIAKGTHLPVSIASTLSFDDLKPWYHSIDILLVTAGPEPYVETGPLPPFEAIVSGVPVIGTRVGNFRHVPGPKFNTIEEAVVILNKLKSDPNEVKRLAEEQYKWVMENWTYKTLVAQWKSMFDTVLQKTQ